MLESFQTLRQFLPDTALVVSLGLAIFAVLELITRVVLHLNYRRSDNFVREQWRRSRHWEEYRALESQLVWHENVHLPTLERLKELESLERQQGAVRQ